MKLLYSNGVVLNVYDLKGPLYRITASAVPIKLNGYHIVEDAAARDTLKALLATGLYRGEAYECDME